MEQKSHEKMEVEFEELNDAQVAAKRKEAWERYHRSLERNEPSDAQKRHLALFLALKTEDLVRKGLKRR